MLTPLLLLLAATATAQRAPLPPPAANEVRVGGSSSLLPVTRIMEAGMRSQARSLEVRVLQATSTGRGFRQLCAGEVDVMGASRPIQEAEQQACARAGRAFVEVPVALDGVAMVAHRDAAWLASITLSELRRLWAPEGQRRVTRWSQLRKDWPDTPVRLVAADVGSGTRDFFAEALDLPPGPRGVRRLRADAVPVESGEAMAREVAARPGTLGFLSTAHAEPHRDTLRVVAVDDEDPHTGAGAVAPSEDTVRGGTYLPFSRPLLLYVSAQALERKGVESFVRFYLDNAPRVTRKAGYVPLPAEAYRLGLARLEARRTGSLFAGKAAARPVEELLRQGAEGAPATP